MKELKIKLTKSEVEVMTKILRHILTSVPSEQLRTVQHVDYLLFSCVSEFYARLLRKFELVHQFGLPIKKPGVQPTISIGLKRHEAIALFMLFDEPGEDTGYLGELNVYSPAMHLTRNIRGLIHQHYMC